MRLLLVSVTRLYRSVNWRRREVTRLRHALAYIEASCHQRALSPSTGPSDVIPHQLHERMARSALDGIPMPRNHGLDACPTCAHARHPGGACSMAIHHPSTPGHGRIRTEPCDCTDLTPPLPGR